MRKQIATVAGLLLVLSLGACGSSKDASVSKDGGSEVAEQVGEAEQTQVFETDQARVEYRETIDSTGNAIVLFALTNNTDKTVMVVSENVVANGEHQITPLGGSDINGIQPGNTGQVSIVFGVSTQTPLSGVDELKTVSADLVLRDSDHLTETVGTVHVDVMI